MRGAVYGTVAMAVVKKSGNADAPEPKKNESMGNTMRFFIVSGVALIVFGAWSIGISIFAASVWGYTTSVHNAVGIGLSIFFFGFLTVFTTVVIGALGFFLRGNKKYGRL